MGIYAALAGSTKAEVIGEFGGKGFGDLQAGPGRLAVAKIGPVGNEMRRLIADPAEIDRVLVKGVDKARAIAGPVVAETKKLVGFWASKG